MRAKMSTNVRSLPRIPNALLLKCMLESGNGVMRTQPCIDEGYRFKQNFRWLPLCRFVWIVVINFQQHRSYLEELLAIERKQFVVHMKHLR